MKRIDVGDAQINVTERGEGPVLVLLHGLFVGSLAQWYFLGAGVFAETHRVIFVDLRGHGRSSRPSTGYDLPTLAQDVHRVLDSLGVDGPIAVAGHSYGGLVGCHLSHLRPVEQLVLIDTPLPGPSSNPALASPDALLDALPGPLKQVLLGGGRRARRLLETVRALAHDTSLLSDMAAEPPLNTDSMQQVHLIYGEASGCLDAETWFLEELGAVSSERLPGGHFLLVECPEQIVGALARVLRLGSKNR